VAIDTSARAATSLIFGRLFNQHLVCPGEIVMKIFTVPAR
jgi:hypothetical protein